MRRIDTAYRLPRTRIARRLRARNPRSSFGRKLRNAAGETIAETLVAILIVTLATVLFATMVGVATSTARKSENAVTSIVEQTSALDASTASTATSVSITSDAVSWNNGRSLDTALDAYSFSSTDSFNNQTISRFVLKK